MEIGTSYVQEVAQVSKTKAVSAYTETNQEKNYNSYSSKEIRDIPYAEAKENYEQIMERVTQLREKAKERGGADEELSALSFQYGKINSSDNDKLNEARYEIMRLTDDPKDAMMLDFEMQVNLTDYYHGKETTASFVVVDSTGSNHAHEDLTRTQLSSINVDEFISKMLETFTKNYAETTDSTVKEQYQQIIDGYKTLQSSYDKAVTEPFYA